MNAFFRNALAQTKEFFTKLSRKEKIRLGVLATLILAFSITLGVTLSRVNYAVLYSNLPPEEAGQILVALEEMGVLVKTQGSDTILVPSERVGEIRMRLEAEGFNSGELPTDLIDKATGFASTAQDRDTYNQLQLQSYLRKGIKRMDKISDCLVLLNLQKESVFALNPNVKPSSASVLLELKEGGLLSDSEAYAVGRFVAMTVPGLTMENISIVDSRMNRYNLDLDSIVAQQTSDNTADFDYQVALRERIAGGIEKQVINLLSPVFGEGHVQAAVSLALVFDKETISSIVFAPPVEGETGGIVVSMKELYENTREAGVVEGVPGTDTNGLGVVEYPYGDLGPDQYYSQVLREMNYEINETRTEMERAQGTIRDLSIGVVIDRDAVADDYTEEVRDLVAQAVGVSTRYVSVARLPIQKEIDIPDTEDKWQEQRDFERAMQTRELIKTAIIALTVLLLALLLYSLLRLLFKPQPQPQLVMAGGQVIDYLSPGEDFLQNFEALEALGASEAFGPLGALGGQKPFVTSANTPATVGFAQTAYDEGSASAANSMVMDNLAEEGLNIEDLLNDEEGKIINLKSESLEQLERFIERDPQSVAQLLRNWLGDS
ncbi:MAG: flagellar M-ring protein FliF [Clostridiales bacterium]|nr:flagellar M-ring protein FliF [Clostridiales bacterium]